MKVSKRAKPFTYRNQCQKHVKTILELRERITEKSKECNSLVLENMALNKDAERYRFIRDENNFMNDDWENLGELDMGFFDNALDEMMTNPNRHDGVMLEELQS